MKKKKTQFKKLSEDLNGYLTRRYTDGKQAFEKMLHIICHKRNAN